MMLSLNSPINRGQIVYNHLIFVFDHNQYENTKIPYNNNNNDKSLKQTESSNKHKNSENYLCGQIYDVMANILVMASDNRITVTFAKNKPIDCCHKLTSGYLYTFDSEFVYISNRPIHIRFEGILSVKFSRVGTLTKYFDLEITETSSIMHKFQNIAKYNYEKLSNLICDSNIYVIADELNTVSIFFYYITLLND